MKNDRKQMLKDIMACEFTLIDLNLFLDTHPDERRAMADYNSALQQLNQLKAKYEKEYGPLTPDSPYVGNNSWRWIDEPWPWQENFA